MVLTLTHIVLPAQYGLAPIVSGIRGLMEDVLETILYPAPMLLILRLIAHLDNCSKKS